MSVTNITCVQMSNNDKTNIERLLRACATNDIEKVKFLLINGYNSNLQSKEGNTPLHVASWFGYTNIVELLLDSGADPNIKNNNDCTPLHYASKFGHTGIVRLLLNAGAKPNFKNKDNKTPLHYASIANHAVIVTLLNGVTDH